MREITIQILIVILLISCSKKQDENTYHISEEPEYEVKSEMIQYLQDSLISIYGMGIIDSFTIIINSAGDTLMRIHSNLDFTKTLFSSLTGNGPKDVIFPIFIGKNIDYDTIVVYELNTHRIKKITIDTNNNSIDFKTEFLDNKVPCTIDFNITPNYIIGVDMYYNKIFVYDKNTNNINKLEDYPKANRKYEDFNKNFVYKCSLAANETSNQFCAAMLNINCINFYNFHGELQKTIVIGDKLYFPKPNPTISDFPGEKKYFEYACGTNDYIYCLYRGLDWMETTNDTRIFVFNWEGEHITTIKTDGNIIRIAADRNNRYLLGLSDRETGSTDIVKIPLEGVLKK
jgi:hypothetical protein